MPRRSPEDHVVVPVSISLDVGLHALDVGRGLVPRVLNLLVLLVLNLFDLVLALKLKGHIE